MADFGSLAADVEVVAFDRPLGEPAEIIRTLADFDIVVLTRERTPFPKRVIDGLPKLCLIISTGARNPSLDGAAAKARGIPICNTRTAGSPTSQIAVALILEVTRRVGYESERLKRGAFWQGTTGPDLEGKTLGVIGLGRLGRKVAKVCKALDMNVIAWSPNLTAEKCQEAGVAFAGSKEALLQQADIITIHVVSSPRS